MRTVYLHGNPGAPAELALLGGEAVGSWIALDRAALPLEPESRIGQLVTSISELGAEGPVRLVDFSAGAHVALQVAARIPAADLTLQLVSPAGPLEIGNFLGKMAGAPIFRAAMQRPRLFAALAGAQSFCAARLPHLLTHFLFATAQGDDRELKADAQFVGRYRQVLQSCLIGGLPSYKAEIEAYVRDCCQAWYSLSQSGRAAPTIGLRLKWRSPRLSAFPTFRRSTCLRANRTSRRCGRRLQPWLEAGAASIRSDAISDRTRGYRPAPCGSCPRTARYAPRGKTSRLPPGSSRCRCRQ